MQKIYKRSFIAVIWNFIAMTFGVIVLFFILGYFFGFTIALVASVIAALFILFNMLKHIRMKVVVDENLLDIYIGSKEFHYDLNMVSIRAERVNNDVFTLYVTDKNGKEEEFDLSLLGFFKYHNLLDDLAITGEKSTAIKVETKKKN